MYPMIKINFRKLYQKYDRFCNIMMEAALEALLHILGVATEHYKPILIAAGYVTIHGMQVYLVPNQPSIFRWSGNE